ncbi:M20/M25/M40 family metallo-hydrolase [Burkholderiaceae bacterium FT117]|uniref:M20/M25/M40 family metallo-hydrolase n=1 Tax=Zeimonas sediminis TaxID=2944268 RepID=UPI0023431FC9|nr:M20/M25/M40 family metallo-hydrolase [Zeimonas sediminis]MCM5570590.1 M20/M25/M40 family metallo-hydrolase [Zeimonas sediminis]
MNEQHDAICRAVDRAFEEQVVFLREMVRVPTDTPPGDNAPHAARAAELLEAMGFPAERHPVPAHEVAAGGLKSLTNLLVRHRFGDGPVVALNAHGDVVPPGDGWTHPPYGGEIVDGRMYGRGVAVSKSDFATYAFALRALRETGLPLAGTVELHFTYDEEFGGELGPGWILARGLSKPDLAIGAGFSYGIVTAHNGCLQLEVTVRGVAAHAAMPETGVDALAGAIAVIEALYGERDAYARMRSQVPGIGCPTINVGRIEGGINTNVVPDRVGFRLDRRMIPEEDPAEVEASLRRLIEASAPAGCRVEIRRLLLARALTPLPGHERLVGALKRHAERLLGEQVPVTGTPLYTDARLYCEAGVPIVLYGAGPRTILEANAKRADENLLLEDLRTATKVVACALHDLLGASPGTEDAAR